MAKDGPFASSEDTRRRLMEAGERLFGERGIYGVTLKEINAAAGQRNESALHYHFGSRAGLVSAILKNRVAMIDDRRLEALEQLERRGGIYSVREVLIATLTPLFEAAAETSGVFHIRFAAQALAEPSGELLDLVFAQAPPGHERAAELLHHATGLDREVVNMRVRFMIESAFLSLASATHRIDPDRDPESWSRFVANIIDAEAGMLEAPITETSLSRPLYMASGHARA